MILKKAMKVNIGAKALIRRTKIILNLICHIVIV